MAEILGLDRLLERKPAQLSGGQRQRVAIGRAMVREPQAFLMDEPLSNLDAKLRVQMRGELARLHDRLHTTTIYVTHDQVEAMTLGDRVAVMRDGVVQQLDTPAALFQRPANQFVAAFIGSPSMNLFEAQIAGREVVFGKHRLPIHADHDLRSHDGKTVILGMRPSDFEDAAVWRDESRPTMDVTVDMAEELGSEVNLIFTLDAKPIESAVEAQAADDSGDGAFVPLAPTDATVCTACVDARTSARPGSPARLMFDPARLYYFDRESGQAIGTAARVQSDLGHRVESVADSVMGLDVGVGARLPVDLEPQLAHAHVDRTVTGAVRHAPHPLLQLIAGQRPSLIGRQHVQQPKLECGQPTSVPSSSARCRSGSITSPAASIRSAAASCPMSTRDRRSAACTRATSSAIPNGFAR